jgi:hypothetical protein
MVQGHLSSDSEDPPDLQEYQYESEGEHTLGMSARTLFSESGRNYRRKSFPKPHTLPEHFPVARAALLAYTRFFLFLFQESLTYPSSFYHRDDIVYLPPHTPTTLVSCSPELRYTTPPLPRTTPQSSTRPLLRARSQPPVDQPISVGLATPPPPATSRPTRLVRVNSRPACVRVTSRPACVRVTSSSPSSETELASLIPHAQDDTTTNNAGSSIKQQSHPARPPSSTLPDQHNRYMTPIYSFLKETDMLRYFKTEDGVSYRSAQGTCDRPIITWSAADHVETQRSMQY